MNFSNSIKSREQEPQEGDTASVQQLTGEKEGSRSYLDVQDMHQSSFLTLNNLDERGCQEEILFITGEDMKEQREQRTTSTGRQENRKKRETETDK